MSDLILVDATARIANRRAQSADEAQCASRASWSELGARMRVLSADAELRCVVIRGAGTKAFGAGADIAEFGHGSRDSTQGKVYGELIASTMQAIGDCIHPTIAMIHGVCVGGGLEIALMCDLRICGEGSRSAFRSTAWA